MLNVHECARVLVIGLICHPEIYEHDVGDQ